VLHTQRGVRHYTVLYSNTARAHHLGKTRDWVVLYFDDEGRDGQYTVITAQWEPLKGKRIVRGRESECVAHYRQAILRAAEGQGPYAGTGRDEAKSPSMPRGATKHTQRVS
jgi:hypothetical protein